jgi:hypothetical protein
MVYWLLALTNAHIMWATWRVVKRLRRIERTQRMDTAVERLHRRHERRTASHGIDVAKLHSNEGAKLLSNEENARHE